MNKITRNISHDSQIAKRKFVPRNSRIQKQKECITLTTFQKMFPAVIIPKINIRVRKLRPPSLDERKFLWKVDDVTHVKPLSKTYMLR